METSNKFYQKKWFAILLLIFFAPVGIFLIFKYSHFKKNTNIVLTVIFGIFFLVAVSSEETDTQVANEKVDAEAEVASTNDEDEKKKQDKEKNAEEAKEKGEDEVRKIAEAELKEQLQFNGSLELEAEQDKIHINITSNVSDGGLFEVSIMDADFNIASEFLEIKDGKIKHIFHVTEWEVGEIAGMALFRFNLDDHPQPDSLKAIYGQYGEKMTGSLTEDNHQNGKNGNIETVTVSYPSETAVKEKRLEQLATGISEIINVSNGIITNITPRYNDGDWTLVNIVVSDAWYYSADHEKERFVESVGTTVETLVVNSGIGNSKSTSVYFVDTYNKTVAEPKIFGGYKIK